MQSVSKTTLFETNKWQLCRLIVMKTLKDFLRDWVEPEIAKYYLGCVLGILELHEVETEPCRASFITSRLNQRGL
jgi:hypothetical protein